MVGDFAEFINEGLFVVDFGAADDEEDGMFGVFGGCHEVCHFFFEKEAGVDFEVIFHCVGRSVSAMNNSEAILDVEVGGGSSDDILDEVTVVIFLARVEAEVFEEGDFDVFWDYDLLVWCW